MSNNELATIDIGTIISAKGFRATPHGIISEHNIQDLDMQGLIDALSELNKVGSRLEKYSTAMPWWLGDYYNLLAKLRVALAGKEAGKPIKPEHAEQMEIEILGSYADMTNKSRDEVINLQRTMEFYPYASRHYALAEPYHREAFAHANGDFLRANGWLDLAEQKQWTVAQMRAFIRKDVARDGATDVDAHVEHEDIDVKAEEFGLWSAKRVREVQSYDEEKCAALLDGALRPTAELIDRLRLGCGRSVGATGPFRVAGRR